MPVIFECDKCNKQGLNGPKSSTAYDGNAEFRHVLNYEGTDMIMCIPCAEKFSRDRKKFVKDWMEGKFDL